MENYKEKYDKALEAIKKYRGAHILLTDDLVEEIFPELKEGSDEMVVKDMIETLQFEVKEFPSSTFATKASVWIPWLEKQLGKKSGWSAEDENMFKRFVKLIPQCMTANDYNDGFEHFIDVCYEMFNWLNSIKERVKSSRKSMDVCADSERKPTNGIEPKFKKPTEEQIATLMHVVNGTPVVKGSYIEGTLTELLNQLKEA